MQKTIFEFEKLDEIPIFSAVEMFWNIVAQKTEQYRLSHLFMLLIISAYTLLGAYVFCAFEQGHELEQIRERQESRASNKALARRNLVMEMQASGFWG